MTLGKQLNKAADGTIDVYLKQIEQSAMLLRRENKKLEDRVEKLKANLGLCFDISNVAQPGSGSLCLGKLNRIRDIAKGSMHE